jgi:aspartate kinase
MALVVKKFGGTSVGSIDRINAVADYLTRITADGDQCICVISAMAGHTNALLEQAKQLSPNPPKREVDMLLTVGERVSMALLSIALHARSVSAISLTGSQCGILTDQTHGNARISKILGDRIRDGLKRNRIVIVAGFQGMSLETKEITTLGRGGSDLTAVAVAQALAVDQCDIYTDVDGVYSADPRHVPSARRLKVVKTTTVIEMAWAGAKVVHPRAAHLAYKFKLPVTIKNSFNLEDKGTLMTVQPMEGPVVEAITVRGDRVYVEAELSQSKNIVGDLAEWLWSNGESVALCGQSQWQGKQTLRAVITQPLQKELTSWLKNQGAQVSQLTPVQVLTIVGQGFLQSPEILQQTLALVDQVPVSSDATNHAISLSLKAPLPPEKITAIHDQLITERA